MHIRANSCIFVQIRAISCKFVQFRAISCKFVQFRAISCKFVQIRAYSCKFVQIRAHSCLCAHSRQTDKDPSLKYNFKTKPSRNPNGIDSMRRQLPPYSHLFFIKKKKKNKRKKFRRTFNESNKARLNLRRSLQLGNSNALQYLV